MPSLKDTPRRLLVDARRIATLRCIPTAAVQLVAAPLTCIYPSEGGCLVSALRSLSRVLLSSMACSASPLRILTGYRQPQFRSRGSLHILGQATQDIKSTHKSRWTAVAYTGNAPHPLAAFAHRCGPYSYILALPGACHATANREARLKLIVAPRDSSIRRFWPDGLSTAGCLLPRHRATPGPLANIGTPTSPRLELLAGNKTHEQAEYGFRVLKHAHLSIDSRYFKEPQMDYR